MRTAECTIRRANCTAKPRIFPRAIDANPGTRNAESRQQEIYMLDVIFIAATLMFFGAAIAYVRFCDRI